MGSWRGFVIPGRSQPNSLKMKVLLVLAVAAAVSAHSGEDYKMFMKWAKGKAMESCWGEDNMKLLTLNMKKAVSKCMQEDAPELDLPPFRYMNRFTNSLVSMDNGNMMENMMKMMSRMMNKEGQYERSEYDNM